MSRETTKENTLELFRKIYSLSRRLLGNKDDDELHVLFGETLKKMTTEKQMLLRIELEISILKINEFMALIGKDKLNKMHSKKLPPAKRKPSKHLKGTTEVVTKNAVPTREKLTKSDVSEGAGLLSASVALFLPSAELVVDNKEVLSESEMPVSKPRTGNEMLGGLFPADITDDEGAVVKKGYTIHRHFGTRY